jgi:hypothetical protein
MMMMDAESSSVHQEDNHVDHAHYTHVLFVSDLLLWCLFRESTELLDELRRGRRT